jgi:tRNA-binding EMAP/Myf-like protein
VRLYQPADVLNRAIVFVAHNFRQELRNRPNQGMVLVQENEKGELGLITKKDIPDFLFLN